MPTPGIFSNLLAWAARNERRLGAALFAFGFLTDFFTFGILPVSVVNLVFLGYLALATAAALGSYAFASAPESAPWYRKALSVIFPLLMQYAFGGLLSGFVVFYSTHSVLAASWPFLIVLGIVYVGNEYFRMYKQYLVFQTTLLFFAFYAYAIFGLPLLIGRIGPWTFLGSTVLALGAFLAFLRLLRAIDTRRFKEGQRFIVGAAAAVALVVCGSYFAGVIPPIPLAMKDGGIYHALEKVPGGYRVAGEAPRAWFDPRTPVIHAAAGTTLYAYSAVAAPGSFASTVVHRWERKTEEGWVTESRISFPISGGREGGYRGYSVKDIDTPGAWRVSVETANGQVIGRIRFDVEDGPTASLIEQTL